MRERLTFANVMSALAVFIALGGSAVAIQRNSVNTKHLKRDAVTSAKVKNESLQGKDLRRDTITSRELRESALHFERFFALSSSSSTCDPTSSTPITCGEVVVNLQEPSQLLLVGAGSQRGVADPSEGLSGGCRFRLDETTTLPSTATLVGSSSSPPTGGGNGFGLSAATARNAMVQPGEHQIELICHETKGDASYVTTLSVLALGGEGVD